MCRGTVDESSSTKTTLPSSPKEEEEEEEEEEKEEEGQQQQQQQNQRRRRRRRRRRKSKNNRNNQKQKQQQQQQQKSLSLSLLSSNNNNNIKKCIKLSKIIIISFYIFLICTFSICYVSHKGFRRSIQFWYSIGPMIIEFKYIKYKYGKLKWNELLTGSNHHPNPNNNNTNNIDIDSMLLDDDDDNNNTNTNNNNNKEYINAIRKYHKKTAPKIVQKVMELGGIYIKIGQFLSSVGSGLIDDEYVTALQPLQDGAPPRSYEEISNIICKSLQIQSLDEIFESFDPIPIGSASIAQAHKAKLKHKRYYSYDNNNNNMNNNRNDIENNNNNNNNNNNVKNKQNKKRNYNGEKFQKNTKVEETIQDVIVKVQYPEVIDWYKADFQNLKYVTLLLNPKNIHTINTLKERHEKELDFRLEANNLNIVSNNMIQHQLQPQFIYIPKVISDNNINNNDQYTTTTTGTSTTNNNNHNSNNDDHNDDDHNNDSNIFSTTTTTIMMEQQQQQQQQQIFPPIIRPTQHVLVMEYIQGTSLADAMEDELNDIAYALGLSNGKELRKQLQKDLKRHFLNGGGDINDRRKGNSSSSSNAISLLSSSTRMTRIMMRIIRTYASIVRHIRIIPSIIRNSSNNNNNNTNNEEKEEIFNNKNSKKQKQQQQQQQQKRKKKIDLSHVIKTLVMVHGYQVIIDGVYNADPHPGNVIIMSDGRLGLIDYGMVGHLTETDRQYIASTVIAFATGDKNTVINNYMNSGYRTGWLYPPSNNIINHYYENNNLNHNNNNNNNNNSNNKKKNIMNTTTTTTDATTTTNRFSLNRRYEHSKEIHYRFAKFHLDKIDLSPIPVQTKTTRTTSTTEQQQQQQQDGESTNIIVVKEVIMWPLLKLLSKSMEYSVPDWIEQMKRIGSLLIGVASQAGRPISLSKEWYPIAIQFMKEEEAKNKKAKRQKRRR